MTTSSITLLAHAVAVGAFACAARCAASLFELSPQQEVACFAGLAVVWAKLTVRLVAAHGYRVLIRNSFSSAAELREGGGILVVWPDYLSNYLLDLGPWKCHKRLPLPEQLLDIDVPEVKVSVEQGLYCLSVNTKVVGTVQNYTAEDLLRNPVAIEKRVHDAIADALRAAAYDKPLEEALLEIQRLFLKDAASIAALIRTPTFKITHLLLDADKHIVPADEATRRALDIVIERKQQAAKRSALEAAIGTEEQKVKLHRVELETERNRYMLQQEVFGKEGAALVEVAKHAKALYVCTGAGAGTAPSVTVLSQG